MSTSPAERVLERLTDVRDRYVALRSRLDQASALRGAISQTFPPDEALELVGFLTGEGRAEQTTEGTDFRDALLEELERYYERFDARLVSASEPSPPGLPGAVPSVESAGSLSKAAAAPRARGTAASRDAVLSSSELTHEDAIGKRAWYTTSAGVVLLLVLLFPVGLYLMWRYADWEGRLKWIVTGALALLVIVFAATRSQTPLQEVGSPAVTDSPLPQEVGSPTLGAPTQVPTPGEEALSEADFGWGQIPGASESSIRGGPLEQNWGLQFPVRGFQGADGSFTYRAEARTEGGSQVSAEFVVPNEGGIAAFSCMVVTGRGEDVTTVAERFLGACATLPYDGAKPDQAAAWVSENLASRTETTFGEIYFRLGVGRPGAAYTLSISALP